jgi:hypothetical protein
MKLFLTFLPIILFTFQSLAQAHDKQESTYLRVKSGEEVTTYEFQSIQDFEENSEKLIEEITATYPTNKKEKDTIITVEISIAVTTNKVSKTLTGSVTASFSTIIIEAKKLRGQLIAIAIV